VIGQIILKKSIIDELFGTPLDGFLKLNFDAGTQPIVDFSRSASLYAA